MKDPRTTVSVTNLMEKNWQGDTTHVDDKSGKCEKQRRQTGRMLPELQCQHWIILLTLQKWYQLL